MAAEVLPSARWLYCGDPEESQRALLGKDCGAGAELPVTSSLSVSVSTALVFPYWSVPLLSWAKIPSRLYCYLGLGQGSSVISPRFCHHLPAE